MGSKKFVDVRWFDVDHEGLAKLVERRGKAFVLYELLQNAWDCDGVTRVDVSLTAVPGRSKVVKLVVEDDHPDGFKNLSHAYTLFAESEKKGDATLRGRFNLGEKLVLSMCEVAEITSTRGSVRFDCSGRHKGRRRRERGTRFEALVRMTHEEMHEVIRGINNLIPPAEVVTIANEVLVERPGPLKLIEHVALNTEIADADGLMRRRYRTTSIEVYALREGERATLYEMGIPVMELGDDPYHVNVLQKVPMGMERESVSAAYVRDVRGHVLDHMHADISVEQARGKWASEAVEEATESDAVRAVVTKRYGELAVTYDPSDKEANNIAVSRGYTVISGGAFTSDAWDKIRKAEVALPAGRVTPSPRPFHPGGEPLKTMAPGECTGDMVAYAALSCQLAEALASIDLTVVFANDREWKFNASYSKTSNDSGTMIVNVGRLGEFFFKPSNLDEQLRLLVHELGHHYGHHLEEGYHEALCRMAGKLAVVALHHPDWFGFGGAS